MSEVLPKSYKRRGMRNNDYETLNHRANHSVTLKLMNREYNGKQQDIKKHRRRSSISNGSN